LFGIKRSVVGKAIVRGTLLLIVGFITGAYFFSGVQPRSLLSLTNCSSSCYRPNDLAGLLAAAAIQRMPGLVPNVVRESERCITIEHPFPEEKMHFVSFPKRDMKDIADISAEDGPFVLECFAHVNALIAQHKLRAYRVWTNGPSLQHVTVLHFHLVAK
jgi:hypothetical protein